MYWIRRIAEPEGFSNTPTDRIEVVSTETTPYQIQQISVGRKMSLEEMLKQMEDFRSRKERRDCRPDWLRQFIKEAANLFEPLAHSGRVGFDCQGHERGWTVAMYLGTTEIIGGPDDGKTEHASFVVDIDKINDLFQSIERLEWYSVANEDDERFDDATRSVLSVRGTEEKGNSVHLELLHSPPQQSAPGLRKSGDDVELY